MPNESVACIIQDNDKILIARRNPTGDMGGRWEFPGGKIEQGETCQTAIIRELQEEFCVKANPVKQIAQGNFIHNEKKNSLYAWLVTVEHDGIEKPYVLSEHTEYKWVFPKDIPADNFVDSDLSIYPEVLAYLESK